MAASGSRLRAGAGRYGYNQNAVCCQQLIGVQPTRDSLPTLACESQRDGGSISRSPPRSSRLQLHNEPFRYVGAHAGSSAPRLRCDRIAPSAGLGERGRASGQVSTAAASLSRNKLTDLSHFSTGTAGTRDFVASTPPSLGSHLRGRSGPGSPNAGAAAS